MNTAAPTLRHSLPGTATGTCHRPCHPKKKHAGLSAVMAILLCLLASCHYQRPDLEGKDLSKSTRDSLTYLYERHYTWNTNLVVRADEDNRGSLEHGGNLIYEDECFMFVTTVKRSNSNDPELDDGYEFKFTFYLKTLGGMGN